MATQAVVGGILIYPEASAARPIDVQALINPVIPTGIYAKAVAADVTNTPEALDLGAVTPPAWVLVENTGDNIVYVREGAGGNDFIEIGTNEFAGPFKLKLTNPFIVTDTGTSVVNIYVVQEA